MSSIRRKTSVWIFSIILIAAATLYPVSHFLLGRKGDENSGVQSISPTDGHQEMVELLQQIKGRAESEDLMLGTGRLEDVQRRLRNLPPYAPIGDRMYYTSRLGGIELIAGETEDAAAHLATAYELLKQDRNSPLEMEAMALLEVAVAHLRLGEIENCVECTTCDSCIFPIRESGIHKNQRGSRKAIEYLTRLLEIEPDHVTARWLLNIASMTIGEYPDGVSERFLIPPERFASLSDFPRFVNMAEEAGVNTLSLSGGVIADDFDNDGWVDVLTSDWGPAGQLRYFRNTGDGKFSEETGAAGLLGIFGGLNLVQGDYDNDGDLDVLVLRGAWRGEGGRVPNSLLRNDGQGYFRDVTFAAGLGTEHFPTGTAAWSDYDNDGDLDLYIGNENFACQLFQNNGQGSFVDVAQRAGVTNGLFTKGVIWGDFNGDRFPDLYVSNYGVPASVNQSSGNLNGGLFDAGTGAANRLYRNNQDGTFTDVAAELNVTRPLLSFPAWFWDFNNDGALDLFVASYGGKTSDVAADYLGLPYQAERDCLYKGNGQGGFDEVSREYGLNRASLTMGANFGDLDNDGFDDIYLGTGAPEYESLMPNLMFHNLAGQSFADVTVSGGFGHLQKGHGIAFADFDHDGDQDVFAVLGGAFLGDSFANALFINPGFGNHWLKVRLAGTESNRFGVGARIRVEIEELGAVRSVFKWVNGGGSFGANPLRKEIGLGRANRIRLLEVYWPTSGQTQTFEDVPLDSTLEIVEGNNAVQVVAEK